MYLDQASNILRHSAEKKGKSEKMRIFWNIGILGRLTSRTDIGGIF